MRRRLGDDQKIQPPALETIFLIVLPQVFSLLPSRIVRTTMCGDYAGDNHDDDYDEEDDDQTDEDDG